MIPMPENPVVVILLDERDMVVGSASNISSNLRIQVTHSQRVFDSLALGKSYKVGASEGEPPCKCYYHVPDEFDDHHIPDENGR